MTTNSSPKPKRRRWLVLSALLIASVPLLILGWEVFAKSLPVWSLIYCAETSFEQLPANDLALAEAIKTMDERVRQDRVEIQRCDDCGAVRVMYFMTGDLWNRPGIEELDRLCAELGYKGPLGKFTPSNVTDNDWQERHDRHKKSIEADEELSGPSRP